MDDSNSEMSCQEQQDHLLFATEIGGPMTFAFFNLLRLEVNKLTDIIQNYGGEVIDYDDRNKFTIVLTKKDAQLNDEIQFHKNYVKDCIEKNEILPLESYRIDKKVDLTCYYSKPLGSTQCIFSKLIRQGRCKKHQISNRHKSYEEDSTPDNESTLEEQLKSMNSQIYVRRTQLKKEPQSPQLKSEPQSQIQDASMHYIVNDSDE